MPLFIWFIRILKGILSDGCTSLLSWTGRINLLKWMCYYISCTLCKWFKYIELRRRDFERDLSKFIWSRKRKGKTCAKMKGNDCVFMDLWRSLVEYLPRSSKRYSSSSKGWLSLGLSSWICVDWFWSLYIYLVQDQEISKDSGLIHTVSWGRAYWLWTATASSLPLFK